MNLLTDAWIPTQQNSKTQLVTLQSVLCSDEPYEIALSRDDMELACLQLLICLTQVLFLPEDVKAWKQRIRTPLAEAEYEQGIENYKDWFDLRHPETPFMQIRGVSSKETTPIQKLFVGLPEGNNHAFFNDAGDIQSISESAATIVLFNQAMNSPSFGGGFKGGFRGGAPITTLMAGDKLRHSIWFNVLHKQSVLTLMPDYEVLKLQDKPVWVEPIKAKSTIYAHEIGLLCGLFWQPAHIELEFEDSAGACEFYGMPVEDGRVVSFKKEKFVYEMIGDWIHPHSPRVVDLKSKVQKYRSFTTTAPAWTQLNHFVVSTDDQKEGHYPAAVVRQFHEMVASNQLIVGGYRNKQAAILQRRHDVFPLKAGWDKNGAQITALVNSAYEIKNLLRNKLYGFVKASGAEGVHEQAETIFYHQSEFLIHQALREVDWADAAQYIQSLRNKLICLSWSIFAQVTQPYSHEPKMIKALAIAKLTLGKEFSKLKGESA
ncbi:type I-E CRISPR-associated protein Cse1/CasA [Thiothrix subterranea]|uniref:type I-E CRISPR-associated protein Cse1/CasA n=1 Tax=Thiothrix subterranea TaxID=2735563 RepID=UPI00192AAEA9|nr:type I-E CRISPR-associated protein Cse1/CasA [Thiothrix subterranea]QQZ30078.1 type I-E CRISPR-associated protein Cse1/CasA [Thiothrix subterranea]